PTGQTQTGGTQTLATTTSSFNGLTAAITIVGNSNTQTFTPSLSGTLNVSGGGTGFTSAADGALVMGGTSATALTTLATTSGAGRFLSLDYTTGRPSWIATSSLGIAITDTTGTLTVAKGGTGQTTLSSSQLLYGAGTGAVQSVATTTATLSGAFSYSGTLGAFVGGAAGTLSLAANGVALTNLAQIAANTVLVNNTSASGNVTAIATSTFFGTGTGGFVLAWNNGSPAWVATSSINNGVSSIQQTGGGSAQTGAITFATSSRGNWIRFLHTGRYPLRKLSDVVCEGFVIDRRIRAWSQ
ncbi:MAG: hypothetical protein ABA06_00005, partial [Parcubacteria bacterium C7867-001]